MIQWQSWTQHYLSKNNYKSQCREESPLSFWYSSFVVCVDKALHKWEENTEWVFITSTTAFSFYDNFSLQILFWLLEIVFFYCQKIRWTIQWLWRLLCKKKTCYKTTTYIFIFLFYLSEIFHSLNLQLGLQNVSKLIVQYYNNEKDLLKYHLKD